MNTLLRPYYRLLAMRDAAAALNRRAAVEDEMLRCARGLDPMPDAVKLREWAQRLGVPEGWRG